MLEQVLVVLCYVLVGETALGLGVSVMILELLIVVVIERTLSRDQSICQSVNLLAPNPGNKAYHSTYIYMK